MVYVRGSGIVPSPAAPEKRLRARERNCGFYNRAQGLTALRLAAFQTQKSAQASRKRGGSGGLEVFGEEVEDDLGALEAVDR